MTVRRRTARSAGEGGPLPDRRRATSSTRPALLMPWSAASVWAIRDANAEHLRTVDTFLEMGKATDVRDLLRRQDKAAGMPWVNTTGRRPQRRRRCTPTTRWCRTCPTTWPSECMTPTGRVLDQLAGLPGLDGTRAGSTCAWRTDDDAVAPRRLRARQPARRHPPRLGRQRQRLLLAAQPRRAARGLRRDHRLRAVRAHDAHPDGLPLRAGPAERQRQGVAAVAARPRARRTG